MENGSYLSGAVQNTFIVGWKAKATHNTSFFDSAILNKLINYPSTILWIKKVSQNASFFLECPQITPIHFNRQLEQKSYATQYSISAILWAYNLWAPLCLNLASGVFMLYFIEHCKINEAEAWISWNYFNFLSSSLYFFFPFPSHLYMFMGCVRVIY